MSVDFDVKGQQLMDFFIGGSVIMDYRPLVFCLKRHLFTLRDVGDLWITCGLLWFFFYQFGLSFWRHPFNAEDPLVSKWCNAKFLQIQQKKKISSAFWICWGWVHFELKWIVQQKWTCCHNLLTDYPNLYDFLSSDEHKRPNNNIKNTKAQNILLSTEE